MKKLIIILMILLCASFAYARLSITDLVALGILKTYKSNVVSSGDIVLWDASTDKVLWDASGDAVLWD